MRETDGRLPVRIEAAAACVARELERVGADAGYVAAPAADGLTIEVARVTPWSERPVRLSFPLDAPYPLAATLRTREALFVASNDDLACSHPGLVRVVSDDHACATVPLLDDDGELLGAVNLAFEEPHPFSDEERAQIEEIGRLCARALLDGG